MRLYRRAVAYFLPDWALIAALVGLIAISVCVALLEAWPIAILIDSVLTSVPKGDRFHQLFLSYLPESRPGQILGLVLIAMVLQIVGYAVWMGRMMINAELNVRGTARVRFDLFRKLQGLGLAYHRGHPQGYATFRLTTDVKGPWGIMELVIGTAVAAVTLCAMTAILLAQSETLAFAAFAVAPMLIASNWFFARRIHHRSLDSKQADADLTSLVQQAIATVGLTQAFHRERHEFGRFRGCVERSNAAFIRLSWQEQLYPLARDIILAFSAAIIFGYGGYLVYRDQFATPLAPGATVAAKGMTVGALLIFIDYTRKLWDPLKWLTEFVAKAQFHVAASQRVFEVLDTPDGVRETPAPVRLPPQPRTLVLDHVGFGYGTETILHDVTAQIRPGELVAFVGPSGAGKSTLLSLILRFYDPTSGAVRLDAADLRQVSLADLRGHMALVGQDNAMLPLSVAENIAYGRPGATRREIAEAAALAGAAEFVAGLPAGYDTVLAEGGQNLSGGQRQRLAIARALLTDAPLLILDEPTSALDPIHERHLVDTIRGLKGQRTIVMVTHRLESVVDCDQIFVLEAGRIVERGPHAALLAKGGRYSRMWRGVAATTPAQADAKTPTRQQAVSNGRRRPGLLRDGTE